MLTGVEAERLRARVNQLTAEVLALKGERESAVHGLTQRDEELRVRSHRDHDDGDG